MPLNLGAARAFKTNDNTQWTPAEMLRALADAIERGDVKADMAIGSVYHEETGAFDHWFCNVNRSMRAWLGQHLIMRSFE